MDGTYTVSDLARASGVTVRTLHHYDQLGLLTPSRRSAAGYRLLVDSNLDWGQDLPALGRHLADLRARVESFERHVG